MEDSKVVIMPAIKTPGLSFHNTRALFGEIS